MKTKHTRQSTFCNLRSLIGLLSVAALVAVAVLASTTPSMRGEAVRAAGVMRRAFMRVTPQGVIQSVQADNSKRPPAVPRTAPRLLSGPLGTTLWQYNDQTAIVDGVSIDANNV